MVARLTSSVPYYLKIRSEGTINQPDFAIKWNFVNHLGRNILGTRVNGAIIEVAGNQYRLVEPLFSLISAMNNFNANPGENIEQKLLKWAEIREYFPEDFNLDDLYLKEMRVVRGQAFTLDVYLDEDGGLNFNPVLVQKVQEKPEIDIQTATEAKMIARPILPEAYQEKFAIEFRRFKDSRTRYALGNGWYLVLDEAFQKVLSVVRKKQEASENERRLFVTNPYSILREELEEQIDSILPSGQNIDVFFNQIFQEPPSYGERVKEIGKWSPKIIPWIVRPKEPWLPPEEIGLRVGDKEIKINHADLAMLKEDLQEALRKGKAEINYHNQSIPVTQNAIDAINTLQQAANEDEKISGQEKEKNYPVVLLIKDNLESLEFKRPPRPGRARASLFPGIIDHNYLKPHQIKGLNWLTEHWCKGSPGALLADDMGLGKTLQALVFLSWVQDLMRNGYVARAPLLVVAPTGLLKNWEDEHDKHLRAPGLGKMFYR